MRFQQELFSIFAMLTLAYGQDDLTRSIDALFQDYTGNRPGAAVLVIQNGRPFICRTYGLADVEKAIPVTPQTNFRLASVSKQFTAMGILILKERGLLTLETDLNSILPEFPAYGAQITIRHLLQHTSGLIDYEDLIPDTATRQVLDHDVLQMMMQQDSTYFPPGTQFRYSNSGYAVLAMVIEKLTRQPFAQFLRNEIFLPLGMTQTIAYEKGGPPVPNRAYGYHLEGEAIIPSDQSLTSAVLGDGGIYASVTDLMRWDQALYTEQLVRRATLQEAFTPGLGNYGFGWFCDTYQGLRRVYHTGSTCGFRNAFLRFPDKRLTVIVLTNRREPDVLPLAERVCDLVLEGKK